MGVRSPSYQAGFYAPERGGRPAYPQAWRGCVAALHPGLGQSGLVLRDWGGRKNHGTLTNGPVWSTSKGRQALSLDGVNDFVACSSIGLTFQETSPYSISAWIRTAASGGSYAIASTWQFGVNKGWRLIIQGRKLDAGLLNLNASAARRVIGTTTIDDQSWHHVVSTYDGTSSANGYTLYVDGKQEASVVSQDTSPGTLDNPSMNIGRLVSNDYPFWGNLTDLLMYDRVLPASEVRQLHRRPGIAYELAPRKFYSLPTPSFSAAWARRQSIIIGGGLH